MSAETAMDHRSPVAMAMASDASLNRACCPTESFAARFHLQAAQPSSSFNDDPIDAIVSFLRILHGFMRLLIIRLRDSSDACMLCACMHARL